MVKAIFPLMILTEILCRRTCVQSFVKIDVSLWLPSHHMLTQKQLCFSVIRKQEGIARSFISKRKFFVFSVSASNHWHAWCRDSTASMSLQSSSFMVLGKLWQVPTTFFLVYKIMGGPLFWTRWSNSQSYQLDYCTELDVFNTHALLL